MPQRYKARTWIMPLGHNPSHNWFAPVNIRFQILEIDFQSSLKCYFNCGNQIAYKSIHKGKILFDIFQRMRLHEDYLIFIHSLYKLL